MTKSEFVERYNVAQEYHQSCIALGDALHQSLLNGYSVVCFGDKLLNTYIEMLAEQSGIATDWIGWLMFEGGGKCGYDDQQEWLVLTPEDLWEFLKQEIV